jgi:site-specific DNA recombinase
MITKRAVIYARVSTDEQAAKGYSLPTQIEACEKYARENGFEIVAIFKDDYTGTVPIELRPEGRKAYEMLRGSEADTLIAYRIDRIVRPPEDGDEWDMPILIRGLAKLNKAIHTLDRGQLKTDFASLLIAMLDAKNAGEERRKLIERTTRGRDRKMREGKMPGTGKPPYGYALDNGALVINETEAVVVRLIYQWYISGNDDDHEPMTCYAITYKLSAMGIPTPGESSARYTRRVRQPGMWSACTVRHILVMETYAGTWRFGRLGSYHKGSKREKRQPHELIAIAVPPIVSHEVWEAAQTRREHNKRISGTKRYLLRGLITCGCGRKMAGALASPCRYRCTAASTYLYSLEDDHRSCHEKSINGDMLEAVVWQYVEDILTDTVRFEAEWHKAQEAEQDSLSPKRERLETVNALITHCEQEAAETAAALKKAKGLVLANLQADMDSIDARYDKLTGERERLVTELETGPHFDNEALARALQFRADVIEGLKHPTFDDKRLYFELLQVAVTVKDNQAVIRCALPIEKSEINLSEANIDFRTTSSIKVNSAASGVRVAAPPRVD